MLANCFEVTLCCSQFSSYSVKLTDEKTSGIIIDDNICRLTTVKLKDDLYLQVSKPKFIQQPPKFLRNDFNEQFLGEFPFYTYRVLHRNLTSS